jgi:uncharacterized membrane protein YtjA (UPF0391 family)
MVVFISSWSHPFGSTRAGRKPGSVGLAGSSGETCMLMTIAIILIVLWLLGMVTANTMGGIVHVLLVIALVIFLVRVIQGRRVV